MALNEMGLIRALQVSPPPTRHRRRLFFPATHLSESPSVLVPPRPDPPLSPRCPVVKQGDLDSQPPLM